MRWSALLSFALLGTMALAQEPSDKKNDVPKATAEMKFPAGVKTDEQKIFYILGMSLGNSLAKFDPSHAEMNLIVRGIQDDLKAPGKFNLDAIKPFGPKIQTLITERTKKLSTALLDKAAKMKGAQKTASGLYFINVKEGTGASPKASDRVKVDYRGTLPDGTEFDSSARHAQAAEIPLDQVIPCWTEGMQKMKVGGEAKLICPANLAYGDRGQPGIPPDAALTFEVKLLDILPPVPASPQPSGSNFGH